MPVRAQCILNPVRLQAAKPKRSKALACTSREMTRAAEAVWMWTLGIRFSLEPGCSAKKIHNQEPDLAMLLRSERCVTRCPFDFVTWLAIPSVPFCHIQSCERNCPQPLCGKQHARAALARELHLPGIFLAFSSHRVASIGRFSPSLSTRADAGAARAITASLRGCFKGPNKQEFMDGHGHLRGLAGLSLGTAVIRSTDKARRDSRRSRESSRRCPTRPRTQPGQTRAHPAELRPLPLACCGALADAGTDPGS